MTRYAQRVITLQHSYLGGDQLHFFTMLTYPYQKFFMLLYYICSC